MSHIGVREVITKEGILVPTPSVQYANLHPSLTRHCDTLTSTDRRINQGADQIDEIRKERISETKDSQLKCLNKIPEYLEEKNIKEQPKKPKAYLNKYPNDVDHLTKGILPLTTTSETYRNVMQASSLVNYDKNPKSITRTDFTPKVLYPFEKLNKTKQPDHCQGSNVEWKKYRKNVSFFADLEVPKRYGYYKFMDDEKPVC